MSAFVPDEEYRKIRESWRTAGKFVPQLWPDRQSFEACHLKVREAAKREADLRRLYDSMPPGDPRLNGDDQTPPLILQIKTAKLDQRHWKEYGDFYRKRLDAQRDTRLPREPGDDDT